MPSYLALLRGINVGGKNIIKMADLKDCFQDLGFQDVATYIQSGNVVFDAPKQSLSTLTTAIEAALSKRFNYTARVVVISHDQLKTVVREAPKRFSSDATKYRCDVLFLKKPLTASRAMTSVSLKPGVDQAAAGKNVVYFSRLTSKATQSHLSRIIKLPIYQSMTIRNWNTTTKLLALMDDRAQP